MAMLTSSLESHYAKERGAQFTPLWAQAGLIPIWLEFKPGEMLHWAADGTLILLWIVAKWRSSLFGVGVFFRGVLSRTNSDPE
jgi:hypothetical protein